MTSRLDGFLAGFEEREPGKPRVRRGGRRQLTPVEVAMNDAEHRAASGDWEGARGSTLVGLYAFCHRLIYGVVPEELQQRGTFGAAAKAAGSLVHNNFDDDYAAAAGFVKWIWERQKRRHTWALQQGRDVNRLGWRLQFSAAFVTDWRVESTARTRRRT